MFFQQAIGLDKPLDGASDDQPLFRNQNFRDLLNDHPHYKNMGLYGSEYWTYLLARRVGDDNAKSITEECLPMIAPEAVSIGFAMQLSAPALSAR